MQRAAFLALVIVALNLTTAGAVDWETKVWVNQKLVGTYRGGYNPFTFDVTDALVEASPRQIVLAVRDPGDAGKQPRGKQVNQPRGIWYTPTTGIWQTVWLEPVPRASMGDLKIVPDIDSGELRLSVDDARAWIDEVRISSAALEEGELLFAS